MPTAMLRLLSDRELAEDAIVLAIVRARRLWSS
jgi:hypothetical protein